MTNEYNPDGKEIRFIDSHYKDLFHIPDGSCVQIHYPDEMVVKPCTFIDEYHTQIGYNVFHICQFAEIMERNGASYMPEPEIMGDEAAWKVGKDRILAVQTCEDGYDYTLLDENYNEIDGGQVDNPELSMHWSLLILFCSQIFDSQIYADSVIIKYFPAVRKFYTYADPPVQSVKGYSRVHIFKRSR